MAEPTNANVFDAMRKLGSNDYQQRVPQASQSGVDAVIRTLSDPSNRSLMNEFEENLINRIGETFIQKNKWANPLATFKRGRLAFGDKIQELAVDMVQATGYDIKDSNLFKVSPAAVYEAFHTVNRKDRYDISISQMELRKAFTSVTGLNDLVSTKLAMVGISAEYDEFRIMTQLISVAHSEGALHNVNVSFADPNAPTEAELKKLSVAIRTYGKLLTTVPSSRYNAKGVPVVSNKENLVLITTPAVTAALDVNVLADAFDQSRANFASRIIEIDQFPMDGVYAMLVDRSWFVCADYVREVNSFWNPKNLVNNYYYHQHGVYSISPFSNAVLFSEDASTSTSTVTVTPTALTADVVDANGTSVDTYSYGDDLKFVVKGTATVTPKNDSIIAPDAYRVDISIVDADDEPINTKISTSISFTGNVRLQDDLPEGAKVTIKATGTYVDPRTGKRPETPLTSTKVLTVA